MRDDERVVRAGDPALPGRRRLVRAARRMLWDLLRERTRELRLPRSQVRRRLGDFLARSTAGRLLAILRSAALSGAMAAALLAPGAAHAQDFPAIELSAIARGEGGFQVRGEGKPGTRGSGLLAGAGDVNGDGIPDVIVAGSLCFYECSSAPAYVVFGKPDGAAVDLAEVEAGRGGFAIRGVTEADLAGSSVSGAGDVNGDGLDDVLVGAPGAGDGYVVFGKPDGAVVELADVEAGQGGFVIHGASSVSGGGDVSGDGLADILVGASSTGERYVVFGKSDGAAIELADVQSGRSGFAIRGVVDERVAAAGDVNGDGLAEIITGAPGASPGGRYQAGESYVVFGKPDGSPVEIPEIQAGRGGFAIRGAAASGFFGASVAGAGDVNGDGLADVIAGAPGVDYSTGESYLVFGKPGGAAVDIAEVRAGRGGFAIGGVTPSDGSGQSVSGAGDVNGDGLADVIIGRRSVDSYVVFGKPGGAAVELSEVQGGQGGFVIHGNPAIRHQGGSVAGAGDVNGDGLGDVLVGGTDPRRAGQGYVVFGKPDGTAVELSAVQAGQGGFAIRGIEEIDYSTLRVAGAGDVNGDGLADILVAAMRRAPDLSQAWVASESRVVFGKLDGAAVEFAEVQAGQGGFVIRAVAGGDVSGSGASAGDVNGDGLADLVIGNSRASPGGRKEAGEAHVVFGKSDSAAVELAAVQAGQGGFAISGVAEGDSAGTVSGAGDVNGDGLDDVVIGAHRASPGGKMEAGESYVVFGKSDGASVELAAIQAGQGGFAIRGAEAGDFAGGVSGAGDVNGDGLADVMIGASRASPGGRKEAGESYVVFGKSDGAAVELSEIRAGRGGFAMRGVEGVIHSGSSVAAAGDVNGDGLADVLVGSPFASPLRRAFAGETFVVLGKSDSTAVELSAIQAGRGGFTIRGAAGEDFTGSSISGAGDLNGDGLADVLVGEARISPESRFAGGDSYVVFGKSSGAPVDLRNVEASRGGFAIRGLEARGRLGPSVAGAGDVDGDGLADDLVIASGLPGVRYPSASGAAYVVFGPRDGGAGTRFRRGAVRGEEEINLSDAIGLLGHLFLGGEEPPCLDAADADDSGALDLTDAIHILRHLFQGGEAPPDPGPASCGRDPTEDDLRCASPTPGCVN